MEQESTEYPALKLRLSHYSDVIMITSKLSVTGLCGGNSPVNSPHKGPVTQKMFPFDDVIMHPIKVGSGCWLTGHLRWSPCRWDRSLLTLRLATYWVLSGCLSLLYVPWILGSPGIDQLPEIDHRLCKINLLWRHHEMEIPHYWLFGRNINRSL